MYFIKEYIHNKKISFYTNINEAMILPLSLECMLNTKDKY